MFVWGFIKQLLPSKGAAFPTRTILHPQSGVVKPGEMCLVLGCPGAGCTTFLKSIANERGDYAAVLGDIRYAGIDAAEMAKMYKGEVLYNQEGTLRDWSLEFRLTFLLTRRYPHCYPQCWTDAGFRALYEKPRSEGSSPRSQQKGIQRPSQEHASQDAQHLAHRQHLRGR